tara:strand:+ start:776 stop:961 length:186 start_codon:yes stop_codon:yes gene_type:complete
MAKDKIKIWTEAQRARALLREITDEAKKLNVDMSEDKIYIALHSYILGLETAAKIGIKESQ